MEKELLKPSLNNFLETSVDLSVDYAETALDYFCDTELIKNVPIIGTLIGLGKLAFSINTCNMLRNYCTFLAKVKEKNISVEALEKHKRELENNPKQMQRELEILLVYLDKYKESEKAKYMGNIYLAFLNNSPFGINWDQATIFFEILDRILISDIEDLKKMMHEGAHSKNFNDHSGLLRLSALGLIQYFNGVEETFGHNKTGLAKITSQGKLFYRVITTAKAG